jgi:hypothetical protein
MVRSYVPALQGVRFLVLKDKARIDGRVGAVSQILIPRSTKRLKTLNDFPAVPADCAIARANACQSAAIPVRVTKISKEARNAI